MKNIEIMKKLLLVVCVWLIASQGIDAQNRCIDFVHPDEVTWKQVLKRAKKEKKMIFVDCYTSWCGPCKRLAKEVFTLDSIADFYNNNFICIKYDVEKDKDKGYKMNNPFGIYGYPTLLYLDAQGNAVHSMMGAYGELVLSEAVKALNSNQNLGGLIARKQAGESSLAFMRDYINAMVLASQPGCDDLVVDYLSGLPDEEFYTINSWKLLDKRVKDVLSEPFRRFQQNSRRFDSIVGKEAVDRKISMALLMESSKYEHWKPEMPFDETRCNRLMAYFQTLGLNRVPAYLATLEVTKNQYHGNYREILNIMMDLCHYNALGNYMGMYLPNLMSRLLVSDDKNLLREAAEWTENLFTNEFYGNYNRAMFLKLERELYKAMNNHVKSGKIQDRLETFAREKGLEINLVER